MEREEKLAQIKSRLKSIDNEIHGNYTQIEKLTSEKNKLICQMNAEFDKEAYFSGEEDGNAYIFHATEIKKDDSSYRRGYRYTGSIIYLDGSYFQDMTYVYPDDKIDMLTKEEYDDMFVNAFNEFLKKNDFDIILTH